MKEEKESREREKNKKITHTHTHIEREGGREKCRNIIYSFISIIEVVHD